MLGGAMRAEEGVETHSDRDQEIGKCVMDMLETRFWLSFYTFWHPSNKSPDHQPPKITPSESSSQTREMLHQIRLQELVTQALQSPTTTPEIFDICTTVRRS